MRATRIFGGVGEIADWDNGVLLYWLGGYRFVIDFVAGATLDACAYLRGFGCSIGAVVDFNWFPCDVLMGTRTRVLRHCSPQVNVQVERSTLDRHPLPVKSREELIIRIHA